MTDEQIEALKAAALAATPQNIDGAEKIETGADGEKYMECPHCAGEGTVGIAGDYCNYDGTAIGVQFYGIGNAHGAAEAYFRAASPANVLALIERLDCAERALLASKPAVAQTYHNDTPEHRAARQAVGIEPADSPIGDMIGDLQSEQTYISSDRDRCHPEYELPRWDRIQRVINYLAATHTAPAQSCGDAEQADEVVNARRYLQLRALMVQTEPPISQGHVGGASLDHVLDALAKESK